MTRVLGVLLTKIHTNWKAGTPSLAGRGTSVDGERHPHRRWQSLSDAEDATYDGECIQELRPNDASEKDSFP